MSFDVLAILTTVFIPTLVDGKRTKTCAVGEDYLEYVDCDPHYEDCCDKGCCPRKTEEGLDLSYLWLLLFFGAVVLFYCWECFQKSSKKLDDNNDERSVENVRSFEVSLSLLGHQHNSTILTGISSNKPLTPPPSYEEALNAPIFDPCDRIPSYEDAIAWQIKTTIPHSRTT